MGDTILFGGGGLAWCKFESISAKRALSGLTVVVDVEVFSSPELGDAELTFFGGVTVDFPNPTGWYSLGAAHGVRPVVLPSDDKYRQRSATVEFALDSTELSALEDLRAGRDLEFKLSLVGTASGGDHPGITGRVEVSCPVSSEAWARVLLHGRSHRNLVLIAPIPSPTDSERLRRADGFLSEAQLAMRDGRFDDAVFEVRKGIEALAIHERTGPSSARLRTVDERVAALAASMFSIGSASGHPEDPNADYQWTREDALLAVAVLIGLIRRESVAPIVRNGASPT